MALSTVQEEHVPHVHAEGVSAPSSAAEKNADVLMSRNYRCEEDLAKTCRPYLQLDDEEPEVDTRCIKIRQPIHSAQRDAGLSMPAAPESSPALKPRLTLSAFRGPAANITQTDPLRKLGDIYDLERPGCSGVLGHGAFSTVRLGVRRSDLLRVAVKSIAKHEALRSRRLRPGRHLEEWEILQNMKGHQCIVQLLDVFENEDEIQLVLEYCEGGELFNAIQRKRNRSHAMRRGQYTEQQAACITSQILRALSDLHGMGIVHRDIKPENLLLVSDDENSVRVKLCDFGMARSLIQSGDERRQGDDSPISPGMQCTNCMVGGSYYAAPEVCYGSNYDTAADVYSLGVTLYIVLCGFPPVFAGPEGDQVTFPNLYWKDISEDAKELVRKMLNPDATARIAANEALRDVWIWKHRQTVAQALKSSKARTRKSRTPHPKKVNLDMVRRRLSKGARSANSGQKRQPATAECLLLSPKRQRVGSSHHSSNSASSALMALADLYRDVAQSPSAKVISSVVEHGPMDAGTFKSSPLPTLSV